VRPPATKRRRERPSSLAQARAAPVAPLEDLADEPLALVVQTELGGVFYLLNLALFLGLYGDFTMPRDPGIALDPWDFLRLVAPRLLDDPARDDPLWRLLDDLAAPRRSFRPPRAWRVPREWLEPFDHRGTWRWSAADGTLRVLHPAAFPVVAVPRTAAPAREQLARELERARLAPELVRASMRREPAPPLTRWVARVAAYADARLRRALDLAPERSLDDFLLRRRGRVYVTPTHVDIVLALAELPLEVRFAGLDRTPGWIPATGRFVAFDFE
jgi:hypothetical protein